MGVRNHIPIEYCMRHYIIYGMLGMSFSYMVTGDLDRLGRGIEMKSAIIRNQSLYS